MAEKGKNRSKRRGNAVESTRDLTEEQVKAAKEAADAQMIALIEAEEATKVCLPCPHASCTRDLLSDVVATVSNKIQMKEVCFRILLLKQCFFFSLLCGSRGDIPPSLYRIIENLIR